MKEKDFVKLIDDSFELVFKIEETHDDILQLENYPIVFDNLNSILNSGRSLLIKYQEDVANMIKSIMPSVNSIANHVATTLSPIQIKVLMDYANKYPRWSQDYERFVKLCTSENVDRNDLIIIRRVIFAGISLVIANKLNNSREEIAKLFEKLITEIIGFDDTFWYVKGKYSVVLMSIFSTDIEMTEMIDILKKFNLHLDVSKYVNVNKRSLMRMFEAIILKKTFDRTLSERTLFHYTTPDKLFMMLKSSKLLFAKTNNLNDLDEGKLLEVNERVVENYTLSFTTKGDSLDLWGNYTNMRGVCIEFDPLILFQTFRSISAFNIEKNQEGVVMSIPFEFGFVIYDSLARDKIKPTVDSIMHYFDFIAREILDLNINWALEITSMFIKREPWEYESELRIMIHDNLSNKTEKIKPMNYLLSEQGIFVKVNYARLIQSIIVGPKLKNNEYEMNNINLMLKKYGLGDKEVKESIANIK